MRPALTQKLSMFSAEVSIKVGKYFFIPNGEHPPCMYPVRGSSSFYFTISTDFSPAALAAFFKSSSLFTGITKT